MLMFSLSMILFSRVFLSLIRARVSYAAWPELRTPSLVIIWARQFQNNIPLWKNKINVLNILVIR